MLYCQSLETEINFGTNFIQPCCVPYNIIKPRIPYAGGKIDMQNYKLYLINTFNNLENNLTNICKDCPYIKNKSNDEELNIKLKSISINMHKYYCNCQCVYCDFWHNKNEGYGYDIFPVLKQLHEENWLHPNCSIHWGGGETSILPGYDNICDWIINKNYRQLVHTNGIRYSSQIAKFLKLGLGTVNISLDSSSAEIYKMVKGVDCFYKVLDNITRYCNDGSPSNIILKYIIFDLNNDIKEIENFLNICLNLNIKHINY